MTDEDTLWLEGMTEVGSDDEAPLLMEAEVPPVDGESELRVDEVRPFEPLAVDAGFVDEVRPFEPLAVDAGFVDVEDTILMVVTFEGVVPGSTSAATAPATRIEPVT